ncbi:MULTISPECIES: Ni/Fe hydrogenase subunit alpha [Synechococcaceae]|uniref:Ni/Fe hydrogenase subunit alpha n=1 Tax=Synechococcaceae TaxID=1890426 RepID=UPI0008FF2D65|nr:MULTISPECIES: Ni/Fe hydrogenase subunit alpha [Synechococcaceae]MCT4365949.1 Ni/Fe hydrogenase subunit alpha [Candidatus Regnicoccus frigidus MAG-AL1]APD48828.1 Ni/Fe hydrogenase subunit alpha [Synechococcus sp. SynAce01]MCT0245146.1 Ni/Fe hydrogenase subunit alpha [Synechococcus sp. CS-601]MCT4366282.1 Ni/Fe hydrogenase subunit alpha [Candidatus Regnicoccus frigidus MAG-AL2]TWB87165.1 NAD(P)-dependent nickel-iron dehydrogenase catalytic subunit [Synechococcus sp. Ace-Pa]
MEPTPTPPAGARRTILIDPVTRIEGHAKITIHLGENGAVEGARFHVTEYRGFERFCEGRPFTEMAAITARICGICPVSHLLAAAKTGDRILSVTIPPTAVKLRRLLNLAQIIQSHALSFFHLSSPDFLLGWDSDPAKRNIFGLIAADPELARGGIRLRQFGQELIERLGGRKIHAAWAVPGGVRSPLDPADREAIQARLSEAFATTNAALDRFKGLLDGPLAVEAATFGCFPSLFMGLVGADGRWEHYDGDLRLIDAVGAVLAEALPQQQISEVLAEAVEPWTYLKFPYYRPLGPEAGSYRVGPLARLNVCTRIGTERADAELLELRQRGGRVVTSSFYYHLARLIEILAALEAIEALLDDPEICTRHVRAHAGVNTFEAVGVSEAPRGTLFHHYRVDANGLIEAVNLIIATGQNNRAMNLTITQIARTYIQPGQSEIAEGLLNRVEAGIRCFDPCLSCSTHAAGQMPLHVQLLGPGGELLSERWRD